MSAMSLASVASGMDPHWDVALRELEAAIMACSRDSGLCFHGVTSLVKRQRASCEELFGPDGKRLATMLGGSEASVEELCEPLFAVLDRAFAQSEADLNATCEELSKVQRLVGSLSKIAVQSRMLGLQAAVEGAWLDGEMGRDFALAAENIRSLADLAAEMTDKVEALVVHLSQELHDFLLQLGANRRRVVLAKEAAAELGQGYQSKVHGAEIRAREAFQRVLSLSDDIHESMNKAVVALQFEDLSTQMIKQIRIRAGDPDAQGEVRVVRQRSMDGGELEIF